MDRERGELWCTQSLFQNVGGAGVNRSLVCTGITSHNFPFGHSDGRLLLSVFAHCLYVVCQCVKINLRGHLTASYFGQKGRNMILEGYSNFIIYKSFTNVIHFPPFYLVILFFFSSCEVKSIGQATILVPSKNTSPTRLPWNLVPTFTLPAGWKGFHQPSLVLLIWW